MTEYVPARLRKRVRDHFSSRCAYCQTAESLTVSIFEIEHIVPRSAGGLTEFQNLCLACPTCNRFKSNRTHGELESGETCRLYHPHLDAWDENFDWSVDGTVLVGLTPVARVSIELLRMNRSQLVSVRELWVDAGRHPPV